MPCTPDQVCSVAGADQDFSSFPNLQAPSPTIHYANMGWVGYVFFKSDKLRADNILRVTSADINQKQEITTPDVIDGRIDKTTYQLGPKLVDGTLSMPLIADVQDPNDFSGCPQINDLTLAGSLLQNLWCWAMARGSHGRLLVDDARFNIRYANHAAFTFDGALCNTLSLSVAQSDAIKIDMNVLGRSRAMQADPTREPPIRDFLSPARVLTWNDISVNAVGGCGAFQDADLFYSTQVREWNLEVNNHGDRFFGFNGSLLPVDTNVGKREITGSLKLMGLQDRMRRLAESNQDRFTEKNKLRFAIFIGEDTATVTSGGISFQSRDWRSGMATPPGNPIFYRELTGVTFKIETMQLTQNLFETNIEYIALANDQTNYESIDPSPNCGVFPAWV